MRIVSNTGPIIGLAKIGQVELLKSLAREVFIPPFVQKELFGKIGSETEHIEKGLDEFIKVMPLDASMPSPDRTLAELDEGERQAVALAFALGEDVLLLMDDYAGRQAARRLKINVTGLVGLLLLAKEKGLVEKVGSLIEELRKAGYWLSDEIVAMAIKLAGEG